MNPIQQLIDDRKIARQLDDTGADTGALALSENGRPTVRTLVLREITAAGITLFINQSSPKWRIIGTNPAAELMIWLHSVQRQYRLSGEIEQLPRAVIEENWHRRPAASKYLDWVYENGMSQSEPINSREDLIATVEHLKQEIPESELTPPSGAAGILLSVQQIELLDLKSPNRIHNRTLFKRTAQDWEQTTLIP